jgi:hypothetical protein
MVTKYGDLAGINTAWGTSYAAVGDIDPQLSMIEIKNYPAGWEEGSPALADLDAFRSTLLVGQFADASEAIKDEYPDVITGVHVFPVFGYEGQSGDQYFLRRLGEGAVHYPVARLQPQLPRPAGIDLQDRAHRPLRL